jgi:hypothetical protein
MLQGVSVTTWRCAGGMWGSGGNRERERETEEADRWAGPWGAVHPSRREKVREATVEWAQPNLKSKNEFQIVPNLMCSKRSLLELAKFEIKYCEIGIEMKNNFAHWNFC